MNCPVVPTVASMTPSTCLDINSFKDLFPIVLKPLGGYGGKGIVKIDGEQVWAGKEQIAFDNFMKHIRGSGFEYLGVKFLKNISEGDKRIIVVDGENMGASLRLPPNSVSYPDLHRRAGKDRRRDYA